MPTTPTVRPAEAGDLAALTGTLTRAFHVDPVIRWAYPDLARRAIFSPRFFAWELRRRLPQGVSWTTTTRTGAALWSLPGQWRETPREALQIAMATGPALRLRAPLVGYGLNRIERLHPAGRHLYLAVLGVDPHHQGSGVGSALLQPGLDLCDEERLPAYLETATERNLDFYGRHGFAVTGQTRLPRGPKMWTMWREPR